MSAEWRYSLLDKDYLLTALFAFCVLARFVIVDISANIFKLNLHQLFFPMYNNLGVADLAMSAFKYSLLISEVG